ncbi:MAG: V-type ATP synthase subunit E [Eubacteriales bacterium]|nr:V-type ATP synthase subunit E [Eubacteriales bacterium]
MDATNILDKIKEDASKKAAEILSAAKEKADLMRNDTAKRILQMQENNVLKLQRESKALEERMLRMAELESKKKLLSSRRELLDRTFEKAVDTLRLSPEKDQKEFFFKQILLLAEGDELILPAERSVKMIDEHFVLEANNKLREAGKKSALRLTNKTVPGTGFVISKDGMEINCTFEALVQSQRVSLEAETAQMLFPQNA